MITDLQRRLRALGLEVRRFAPEASQTASVAALCRTVGIDLVLDVGASVGQFAGDLRSAGYGGRILSFEPLPDAWAALARACRRDPGWTAYPRCAIGATDGEIEIHVAANSVSSSALPMLDTHREAAPESAYRGSVTVPLRRLDDVVPGCVGDAASILLKIDTQGYEWQVLDGASTTLARVGALAVELSVIPLYEGQQLWQALIARLDGAGFELWSLHPGFADRHSGRVLQYDGLFRRR